MRGRFVKKIERPKGYVNIDEVYEILDGVDRVKDCELGDYGEVLSEWNTCEYGEVLDAISRCDVVKVVPLDKIKQAREEIEELAIEQIQVYDEENPYISDVVEYVSLTEVRELLDELITESEE